MEKLQLLGLSGGTQVKKKDKSSTNRRIEQNVM